MAQTYWISKTGSTCYLDKSLKIVPENTPTAPSEIGCGILFKCVDHYSSARPLGPFGDLSFCLATKLFGFSYFSFLSFNFCKNNFRSQKLKGKKNLICYYFCLSLFPFFCDSKPNQPWGGLFLNGGRFRSKRVRLLMVTTCANSRKKMNVVSPQPLGFYRVTKIWLGGWESLLWCR